MRRQRYRDEYDHTRRRHICDLNPIELIWANIKHKIRSGGASRSTVADISSLGKETLDSLTEKEVKDCVGHSIKEEDYYREKDGELPDDDMPTPTLIINLETDDSTDEDEDNETAKELTDSDESVEF
jgi:hypothetical protein